MNATVETHPLISLRSDSVVADAARLMADCGMGAVGVLDGEGRFAGVFTERDLTDAAGRYQSLHDLKLADVVNDFPVVMEGPVSVDEAKEQMRTSRIRHVIVRNGDDYSVVSMRDLFTADTGTKDIGYLGRFAGQWPARAEEVMTTPAIACRGDARLEEVAEILSDKEISGMPVVDEEENVIGVISERDVAHILGNALVRLAIRRGRPAMNRGLDGWRAKDAMSSPVISVSPDTPVTTVAEVMFRDQINRVPVAKSGRLLGVVTRGDVLAAFAGIDHETSALEAEPVVVGGSWVGVPRW